MMNARSRQRLGVLALATLLGCGQASPLSPKAYEVAMATYSVCNRKDTRGLATLASMIEQLNATGQINNEEAIQLRSILEIASAGQWKEANQSVRALMEEQVSK